MYYDPSGQLAIALFLIGLGISALKGIKIGIAVGVGAEISLYFLRINRRLLNE